MAVQVVNITCPGCGSAISISQKTCEWCNNPVVVSTFNSVYDMPDPMAFKYASIHSKNLALDPNNKDINTTIAMCFLKLKNYTKALEAFERAMENNFDNAEIFFYAAICLLEGKKAFLHQRPTINKAIEYINAAIMIEPRGIFYYLLAYIKYDYFSRKFLNVTPNYQQTLLMAKDAGYSELDTVQLYSILGVDKPSVL